MASQLLAIGQRADAEAVGRVRQRSVGDLGPAISGS